MGELCYQVSFDGVVDDGLRGSLHRVNVQAVKVIGVDDESDVSFMKRVR